MERRPRASPGHSPPLRTWVDGDPRSLSVSPLPKARVHVTAAPRQPGSPVPGLLVPGVPDHPRNPPAPEPPRPGLTGLSGGHSPRNSPGASEGRDTSGRGLGGPGRPPPAEFAQEPAPQHWAQGGSRLGRDPVPGMVPPTDGTQAPQSSRPWSPGVRGHRGTLRVPVGKRSRIGCGSRFGQMTEGSRALSECDRHLDAHSHAFRHRIFKQDREMKKHVSYLDVVCEVWTEKKGLPWARMGDAILAQGQKRHHLVVGNNSI
ncbi:hypothetical protein NDU88_009333 [Pleurodeles waltl]|uniref:Uncharacterized protein n=1 Tax=Pleurodeles waltl TaxID=8319 RepID=A0AAV7NYY8_PLEWA|nr:hypothetical protein NDU88_009333 [Pleurodeles waltl]